MSEQQNNGQRRNQGGNRNNNNRNRNNNRSNNNRGNNNRNHKKRTPKPLVLNGWQKFLKAIGLFNEEKARKKQQQAEKVNRSLDQKKNGPNKPAISNNTDSKKPSDTRNAGNTGNAKPRRALEKVAVETPRLYVGNLSYDASDSDIEELFKGIGNVKNVEIIYNRHTHRSKGYGFVQMFNTEDAKRAVEVLHDQPFLGRNLIVNGSKARNPDDPAAQKNNDNEEPADTSAA